jgi:hypothetical protein
MRRSILCSCDSWSKISVELKWFVTPAACLRNQGRGGFSVSGIHPIDMLPGSIGFSLVVALVSLVTGCGWACYHHPERSAPALPPGLELEPFGPNRLLWRLSRWLIAFRYNQYNAPFQKVQHLMY